jgi:hypothetical protein
MLLSFFFMLSTHMCVRIGQRWICHFSLSSDGSGIDLKKLDAVWYTPLPSVAACYYWQAGSYVDTLFLWFRYALKLQNIWNHVVQLVTQLWIEVSFSQTKKWLRNSRNSVCAWVQVLSTMHTSRPTVFRVVHSVLLRTWKNWSMEKGNTTRKTAICSTATRSALNMW